MNSEEGNLGIIVSALNLIKKNYKKYKNSWKKKSICKYYGYSVGLLMAYTTLNFSFQGDIFKIFNNKHFYLFLIKVEINFKSSFL